ncbi:MAG: cob(I)yrinic acid a,c-diamide adenosyltransferase [Bdellovibrionaceae bacterium]|nr:cob(I)yrinic acid a,c-diamide adenosyltransferase [Pseudobdellovibrionaceae bacterium]
MKIYTKVGDKGTTRLVDGSCVEKHNPRVEAYGSVDELNSYVGVVISELAKLEALHTQMSTLQKLQHHLFRVGSLVATNTDKDLNLFQSLPQIDESHIHFLEQNIDALTADLPILKNFILPSGHPAVASAHVARTLCRRAERRVSEIYQTHQETLQNVLVYLNRLSDYLFTLARYITLKTNSSEIAWDKSQ